MKHCPVCNTTVEDLYTGLCHNQACTWEFEFVSEMTPQLQVRYQEKLTKAKNIYCNRKPKTDEDNVTNILEQMQALQQKLEGLKNNSLENVKNGYENIEQETLEMELLKDEKVRKNKEENEIRQMNEEDRKEQDRLEEIRIKENPYYGVYETVEMFEQRINIRRFKNFLWTFPRHSVHHKDFSDMIHDNRKIDGWFLPSVEDWEELFNFLQSNGIDAIKALNLNVINEYATSSYRVHELNKGFLQKTHSMKIFRRVKINNSTKKISIGKEDSIPASNFVLFKKI